MKKFLLVTLIIGLLLPQSAIAGDGAYVKGNVGIFMMEDSSINFEYDYGNVDIGSVALSTGFGLSAAVGSSHGNFDVELEFSYRKAEADKFKAKVFEIEGFNFEYPDEDLDGSINIKTLMTNGIYNFKNSSSITPYVGAGLGVAWIDIEDFDGTEFAYQVLAGVDMELNKNLSILLGYRYLGMGDISDEAVRSVLYQGETYSAVGEDSTGIDSHSIDFGLKYSF